MSRYGCLRTHPDVCELRARVGWTAWGLQKLRTLSLCPPRSVFLFEILHTPAMPHSTAMLGFFARGGSDAAWHRPFMRAVAKDSRYGRLSPDILSRCGVGLLI